MAMRCPHLQLMLYNVNRAAVSKTTGFGRSVSYHALVAAGDEGLGFAEAVVLVC